MNKCKSDYCFRSGAVSAVVSHLTSYHPPSQFDNA